MRALLSLLILGGVSFTQCDVVCTTVFVYGLNVRLTDSESGQPITGATLILTDGDYTETMMETGDGQYVGAGERAGTYELTITADSYATETRGMIVITADECHVQPVNLDIELTPES